MFDVGLATSLANHLDQQRQQHGAEIVRDIALAILTGVARHVSATDGPEAAKNMLRGVADILAGTTGPETLMTRH